MTTARIETAKDVLVGEIDVTPDKRILQSISSDIDLKRGILELVDNSIDAWRTREYRPSLEVHLNFDTTERKISFEDNAGGIREENLSMVIQPGGTTRIPTESTIGEFGIGLKRAIVAIAKDAEVKSRFEDKETFKIHVDDSWTRSATWKIPKYKTNQIEQGSTLVRFNALRFDLNIDTVNEIKALLAETYCYVPSGQFTLTVDGHAIECRPFSGWAFPPLGRHPRSYKTFILHDGRRTDADITVGLMLQSSQIGEYGVDIFCNDRLIVKNYKDPKIGFRTGVLGSPHPSVAWFKAIVQLFGANSDMPWNSTKSGLDFANPIVDQLIEKLIQLAKPYVQLSRRLVTEAESEIGAYPTGKVEVVDLTGFESLRLNPQDVPNVPPGKRTQADRLLSENKDQVKMYPWTRGLIENVYVADLISDRIKLENRNRFALILLDSCLEIAFKDYIYRVKALNLPPDQKERLKKRENLHKIIKDNSNLSEHVWKAIEYYYDLRCNLYHEVASPEVTDSDIEAFRELVATVLHELHGIIV